ncbi:hypothetical protein PDN64_08710 [Bacillus cereus group sp. Bc256]|nr:hypothetical protein [Bacillus cereus group sp. Bc256]MDA2138221.1 hypothetical protein [Bacillus cereus group sp. Bc256]
MKLLEKLLRLFVVVVKRVGWIVLGSNDEPSFGDKVWGEKILEKNKKFF